MLKRCEIMFYFMLFFNPVLQQTVLVHLTIKEIFFNPIQQIINENKLLEYLFTC